MPKLFVEFDKHKFINQTFDQIDCQLLKQMIVVAQNTYLTAYLLSTEAGAGLVKNSTDKFFKSSYLSMISYMLITTVSGNGSVSCPQ